MKRICALLLIMAFQCMATMVYGQKLMAEQRAQVLLGQLTLEEKISLMQHNSPAIPRLGIKEYNWWNEALHGVGRFGNATVFPQAIGMASSFNDDLLYQVFTAVSDEVRAKSNEASKSGRLGLYEGLTVWTPNINIFRDPRWGRGQETYGEDPYLTGRMGIAVIRGLQGPQDAEYDKLHACAKHFAVHSGPEWNRHSFDAKEISQRDLWETYLPAFKDAVQKANVKEVMCAYNRYEGSPCCGNNQLLTQILRYGWGYKGIVVSDCWAIPDFYTGHFTHPDAPHAVAGAVLNGTDLECGNSFPYLNDAVQNGLIEESELDIPLLRLLTARYELGEMEEGSYVWDIPYSVVDSEPHRDLALRMARESIVLLQNNEGILPLNKDITIAVMGPNAKDSVMQWGNYNGIPSRTITLLDGIREKLPDNRVIFEQGCAHTNSGNFRSLFNECRTDNKTGFSAEYWNNSQSEGKPIVSTHIPGPFAMTTMGATAFAPGVNIRDFSGRYKTTFTPAHSGDVALRMKAIGGVEIFVNGKQVEEAKFLFEYTDLYSFKAEKGVEYNIEVRFRQLYDDDASFSLDIGETIPVDTQQTIANVKDADVVIFAGGISPMLEGEEMPVTVTGFKGGDRTDIELPEVQRKLINALAASGKKVILVNFSGSAIGLVPETQTCEAIIQAWYPGQAGGTAIADVLFGDYNPAGRLPVTFYKSTAQLPDFEDYSMKGRTYRYMQESPLFPFGYGLSYTTFSYGEADIVKNGNDILMSIEVTNTGNADGDEVVQVYMRKPGDSAAPIKTLRAFRRVKINKGDTINVSIPIPAGDLEWFDTHSNSMKIIPGEYEFLYGGSSRIEDLKTISFSID